MSGRAEIRDVILGVAEGATGGVIALRDADVPARLEDFDVEVTYGGCDSPDVSVSIRFTIAAVDASHGHRVVA